MLDGDRVAGRLGCSTRVSVLEIQEEYAEDNRGLERRGRE